MSQRFSVLHMQSLFVLFVSVWFHSAVRCVRQGGCWFIDDGGVDVVNNRLVQKKNIKCLMMNLFKDVIKCKFIEYIEYPVVSPYIVIEGGLSVHRLKLCMKQTKRF